MGLRGKTGIGCRFPTFVSFPGLHAGTVSKQSSGRDANVSLDFLHQELSGAFGVPHDRTGYSGASLDTRALFCGPHNETLTQSNLILSSLGRQLRAVFGACRVARGLGDVPVLSRPQAVLATPTETREKAVSYTSVSVDKAERRWRRPSCRPEISVADEEGRWPDTRECPLPTIQSIVSVPSADIRQPPGQTSRLDSLCPRRRGVGTL